MIPIRCKLDNYKWCGRTFRKGAITNLGRYQSLPDGFEYPKGQLVTTPFDELKNDRIFDSVVLIGDGPSKENVNLVEKNIPVAVVNEAGYWYDSDISYWISLHPQNFGKHLLKRKKNGYNCSNIYFISTSRIRNPKICYYPSEYGCGSSSLYALNVLENLGYKTIYIYGIDLTDRYKVFRPYWESYSFSANIVSDCSEWMNDLIFKKMGKK
jgi:hypothetical protein